MLKIQKIRQVVFAPTRKRGAGQNPGATKIPLPLRAGDKKLFTQFPNENKENKTT